MGEENMKNDTLRSMTAHRSIRAFAERGVDSGTLHEIIHAVQCAPTWVNLQHVSIVAVEEPARREEMARLCGRQMQIAQAPVFLAFCSDFYRTQPALAEHGESLDSVMRDPDILLVSAYEVGIAIGTAVAAAESMGLGTCVIGDIRLHPHEVAQMLHLPEHVFPMLGLCVGYAAEDPGMKPRLPESAVFFRETYNTAGMENMLRKYDAVYARYLKERPWNNRVGTWTELAADFYKPPYNHYPQVPVALKEQGFPHCD